MRPTLVIIALLGLPTVVAVGERPEEISLHGVLGDCTLHGSSTRAYDVFAMYARGTCVLPKLDEVCYFAGEPETGFRGRCGPQDTLFAISPSASLLAPGTLNPRAATITYGERAGPGVICLGHYIETPSCSR